MPSDTLPPFANEDQKGSETRILTTDDIDEFVETAALTSPGIMLEKQTGWTFSARSQLCRLPRLAVFSTDVFGARVLTPTGRDYISVTIALNGAFEAGAEDCREVFEPGAAHLLDWDEPLGFLNYKRVPVLVLNLDLKTFQEHWMAQRGDEDASRLPCSRLDLRDPAAASFARYATFLWSEIGRRSPFLDSPRAVVEIENTLASLLSLAVDRAAETGDKPEHQHYYTVCLKRAEDYLHAHMTESLSLADLAKAVGISGRTLNRAFKKQHGIGPMHFLKARRLELVQRALLAADPKSATITEIALHHGLFHPAQFAADYRKMFGELPSETLRR
jgi:AraC-like DNA-binding protein